MRNKSSGFPNFPETWVNSIHWFQETINCKEVKYDIPMCTLGEKKLRLSGDHYLCLSNLPFIKKVEILSWNFLPIDQAEDILNIDVRTGKHDSTNLFVIWERLWYTNRKKSRQYFDNLRICIFFRKKNCFWNRHLSLKK